MTDQLNLFTAGLPPLQLHQRVRTPGGYDAVVAQVGYPDGSVAVFAWNMPGVGLTDGLPMYRRDEVEALPLLDDAAEAEARRQICRAQEDRHAQT